MSLAYQWTPTEIGELTLPQLALYLAEAIEPEGRVAMPVEAGVAYVEQRRAQRRAWVDEVLQTTSENAPHQHEMQHGGETLPTPARRPFERTSIRRDSPVLRQRDPLARRLRRTREVQRVDQGSRTDEQLVVNVAEWPDSDRVKSDPVPRTSSSPIGSQVLLDELRHRMTLLDSTTSAIEVAVESLRRQQSAAARFS